MSDIYTWRHAEADAHYAAAEDFAYAVAHGEDLDYGDDSAHEWADGSAWVIYTHRARCLWMDSREVQDAEGELDDIGVDPHTDIDGRIALCVYFALRAAYMEKWEDLRAEADDAENDDDDDDDDGDAEPVASAANSPRGFMEWSFTTEVVARKEEQA